MVTRLIEYHVVPGVRALSTQLVNGTMVPTALGATKTLTILVENGSVDVEAKDNTAKVVKADLQTCNGVIHAVDKVRRRCSGAQHFLTPAHPGPAPIQAQGVSLPRLLGSQTPAAPMALGS